MNLRFEGLKRLHGTKTVLDIEFGQINHGKITGLIGSNGAGKSTFLNIIAGLDKPSDGRVLYGVFDETGKETFSEDPPMQNMTLVFQRPYIMHTSVEKNIAYPLRLRKMPKEQIDERVAELIEELGLSSLSKQRGNRLSGGESQKVAFARAFSFRPGLLLMDEPTANVDYATTADIERIIKKENQKSAMTMVFVSHSLAQIRLLCDEVIYMDKGRIVETGTVGEVFGNPRDPMTKSFLKDWML